MQETKARRDTRELHLEMVGDKVTYVRVYRLRSQVRALDHRSYSSFKLKWGYHFYIKHCCVHIFRVALAQVLE